MKKFIWVVLAILCLAGCTTQQDVNVVQNGLDLGAQKVAAQQIMTTALDEFYAGISSQSEVGLAATQYSVKDTIIGYAFEAYNTGDDSKLFSYLKEQGLYEKYMGIVKKYDLEAQQEILNTRPATIGLQSVSTSFFDNYLDGDFFLCYGGGSSSSSKLIGWFIPGLWKHAGIMDTLAPDPSAPILSASDQTTSGFCVGYETKTKWAGEASVSAWRVYGRNATNSRAAVNYAKQFIGRPYNVFVSRMDDSSWYCSKVVYRGWLSQGINIEPTPGLFDTWVTPTDLGDDNDTYWIGGDQS